MIMFTIDLLKGSGRPEKSSPGKVALAAVPFIVPLIIAVLMMVNYSYGRTILTMCRASIDKMTSTINEYSVQTSVYNDAQQKLKKTGDCLAEVAESLDRHVQCSGIIDTVVRQMPESITLTRLTVKSEQANRRNRDNLGFAIIVNRTLKIKVCGLRSAASDQAVQEYLNRLRSSGVFTAHIDTIRIASRTQETIDDDIVPCYEIECIFRPKQLAGKS